MQIRNRTLLLVAFTLLATALFVPANVSSQTAIKYNSLSEVSKSFIVIVSRDGFNGTNKPLFLNLTQGEVAHITFVYGDGDLPYDNPHVIFLQGYDLKTGVIGKSNPSATLDFIADETGSFVFYCLIPCEGMMNLSSGRIVVERRQAGGLPTTLEIVADEAAVQGQKVSISATLTQGSQPVPNARVDFYVNTTFGLVRIGKAVTDQFGVARIGYRFAGSGNIALIVEFAGTESLAASSERLNVFVEPRLQGSILVSVMPDASGESVSRLPYVRGQNRMPDLRLVGVPFSQGLPYIALILLIVGSVWAAYGYVFGQIRAIMRGSPPEQEEKEGGEGKLESTPAKKGFDKRILVGAVLIVVVVVGLFAYYQYGAAPQRKTETIKIDIKMAMEGGEERHVFDPATVTVHKGDHIVLIATNRDDDAIHGIVIPELNLSTPPLSFNQQAKLEFDANTTGTYTILCSVPGCAPDHAQMIGHIVVVE